MSINNILNFYLFNHWY